MINVTIYRFTGKQGFFSIPKKWCEECDLLVALTKSTIREQGLENQAKLTIKPWWLWFWQPLLSYLAWHAPILIINGKLVSQGIVPPKKALVGALTAKQNVGQTTAF